MPRHRTTKGGGRKKQCGGAEFDSMCVICGYVVGMDFGDCLNTVAEFMPNTQLAQALLDIDTRWMWYHQLDITGGTVYLGKGTSGSFRVMRVSDGRLWDVLRDRHYLDDGNMSSFHGEIVNEARHTYCINHHGDADFQAWTKINKNKNLKKPIKPINPNYQYFPFSDVLFNHFRPKLLLDRYTDDVVDEYELGNEGQVAETLMRLTFDGPNQKLHPYFKRVFSRVTLGDIEALRDILIPPGLRKPIDMRTFLDVQAERMKKDDAAHQKALGWSWRTFDHPTLLVPKMLDLAKKHDVKIHDLLIALRVTGVQADVEQWGNHVDVEESERLAGGAGGGRRRPHKNTCYKKRPTPTKKDNKVHKNKS
jgi:hypothetical protein